MNNKLIPLSILTLALLSAGVRAAVSPEEAAQLGSTLTPLGAEKAGNADGTIPAWNGGLSTDAGAVDAAGFLADPFASEQPLFSITAQNVEQYKDKLTPGQVAMFKRYPDTYKMNVYPTHRSASMPDNVYEYAKKNALNTQLVGNGDGLKNFVGYFPFPIPKSGVEVVWNHITRYRGGSVDRKFAQIVPDARGGFTPVIMHDTLVFTDFIADYNPAKQGNILFYWLQAADSPARLAGNITLVHETINQVEEPRMAWVYNAGQRRVRRAPQVAYDGPIDTAEGHRTADNFDLYNGSPDRYEWKLEGKKELYIPYNSYKLDSPKLKYADIIRAGHMNPDLQRYELHRVWHVTATLKAGERHIYAKRDFYFDEDTWQAAVIDHYDGRGSLWRVAEGHAIQIYDKQVSWYAAETLHDLISGRYLVLGLKNEEKNNSKFGRVANTSEFTPNALRQSGVR
ncbi:DUF1329 domain-containing protein [Stutzerimonas stutzeri]